MKRNQKNEELQSRREFFKKAAKGALPILGAVVLSNTPLVSKAASEAMGCNYNCWSSCTGGCRYACSSGCKMGCRGGAHGY